MGLTFTEIVRGRNLRTGEHTVHLANYPFGFSLKLDRDDTFYQTIAVSQMVEMRQQLNEISIWCRNHFGPDDYRFVNRTYWFKKANHALEFKLRWL